MLRHAACAVVAGVIVLTLLRSPHRRLRLRPLRCIKLRIRSALPHIHRLADRIHVRRRLGRIRRFEYEEMAVLSREFAEVVRVVPLVKSHAADRFAPARSHLSRELQAIAAKSGRKAAADFQDGISICKFRLDESAQTLRKFGKLFFKLSGDAHGVFSAEGLSSALAACRT
jgi:hypothetical protein